MHAASGRQRIHADIIDTTARLPAMRQSRVCQSHKAELSKRPSNELFGLVPIPEALRQHPKQESTNAHTKRPVDQSVLQSLLSKRARKHLACSAAVAASVRTLGGASVLACATSCVVSRSSESSVPSHERSFCSDVGKFERTPAHRQVC
eukprot:6202803-Pleurochrysis_carterae.AAC.1